MSCGASTLAAAASSMPCSPRSAELRDAEAAAEASSVAAGSGSEDICRFCLEGAALGELIAPCRCRGSSLYVHESCLSRWRAMKERAFSSCLECGASYKLRLRRPAAGCQALGLWRTRALDVLLRDFIPVFLLLQLVLVGLAYGLAAADPRRRAFRALGGYTCRVTALMPPPRGFGIGDDDDDASYDEKARALAMAAAVTALRKACTREFYYIAAFFVAMASAAAVAVAAAVGQWLSTLLCSDDALDSIAAEKQQAEPPAPGISPLAPRDMCVIFTLVLSAWLVGGVAGGVLAFIAAALRSAQLRALQRQRWRLVRCYAVVDGAYAAAGQGCERAHARRGAPTRATRAAARVSQRAHAPGRSISVRSGASGRCTRSEIGRSLTPLLAPAISAVYRSMAGPMSSSLFSRSDTCLLGSPPKRPTAAGREMTA